MNLEKMTDQQRLQLRKKFLRSFFCFAVGIMGYDDIEEKPHGEYCRFLESEGRRKQATMPRSFVKTWLGTIAYPIWVTLPRTERDELPEGAGFDDKFWTLGPNMRVLIASYVITNAEKMISLIRKTYEANQALQIFFPEVIPENFNKVRWSNQSACINRTEQATESTYEAAGIGGASTSRHYDLIIEDDLIYANKDDFSGQELQPNQDDIDKAIGWHKLCTSLLVPGKHTRIHNTGTRWAKKDLVDYIWANEPSYIRFIRGAVDLEQLAAGGTWQDCDPTWASCYGIDDLQTIADAQGPYMFATQYLLKPTAPEDMLFKEEWLQFYDSDKDLPESLRIFTTVDLAGWGGKKRVKHSKAVVMTCGWDEHNHMWILGYDRGRFDPSKVIELMAKHWRMFGPERIGVEEVYYQKALGHFARRAMQNGYILNEKMVKVPLPWMTITAIKPEGTESKDMRIMAIEPIASNHAIHCRREHGEFITEFIEYSPGSDVCMKDLLDTVGYQIRIAKPGEPVSLKPMVNRNAFNPLGNMDDLLKGFWDERDGKLNETGVEVQPFADKIYLSEVTDPFYQDWE